MRIGTWRVSLTSTAALALACGLPSVLVAQAPPTGGFMNIGFVGIANAGWSSEADVGSLQLGAHDPRRRGFSVPNVELTLDAAVDPYFRGVSNFLFALNEEGETI